MKVYIAGTGAMGATYGTRFLRGGHEVCFLDTWEENLKAMREKGIRFLAEGKEEQFEVQALRPEAAQGTGDLIIVFTKSMQLEGMLKSIAHLIGEQSKILCLLNGLGHCDTLCRFVRKDQIIMGVTVLTAGMQGPGQFSCGSFGKTEIQNLDGDSEACKALAEEMSRLGLPTVYAEDIMFSIWRKACINGTMNCCCALLDCNMRELGRCPELRPMLAQIIREFAAVAEKEGTHLPEQEMTDMVCWYTTDAFPGVDHYPSMHQDLCKNHRLTEIDYLNGYVARKGQEYGLDVPYCSLITRLIHGKEKVLVQD